MRCLFVGGSRDGQVFDIKCLEPEIMVNAPIKTHYECVWQMPDSVKSVIQSYKKVEFCDGERGENRYVVYMHGDVARPFKMLIDGYHSMMLRLL